MPYAGREKWCHENATADFAPKWLNRSLVNIKWEKTVMTTAKLVKWVRDPRSGESHLPGEGVPIISNMRNLDRTLVKVKWQAGGECVLFPEDLGEVRQSY
jgi:hypothetical protein